METLLYNYMSFLKSIVNMDSGSREQEKLVSQKSKFLKNLGKPRPEAFFLYISYPYKTFLFNTLGRTMACYATFLSLKNGFLCSKIAHILEMS